MKKNRPGALLGLLLSASDRISTSVHVTGNAPVSGAPKIKPAARPNMDMSASLDRKRDADPLLPLLI